MADKFSFELWRILITSENSGITRYLNTWSKWNSIAEHGRHWAGPTTEHIDLAKLKARTRELSD
jgi:hypothetical protein